MNPGTLITITRVREDVSRSKKAGEESEEKTLLIDCETNAEVVTGQKTNYLPDPRNGGFTSFPNIFDVREIRKCQFTLSAEHLATFCSYDTRTAGSTFADMTERRGAQFVVGRLNMRKGDSLSVLAEGVRAGVQIVRQSDFQAPPPPPRRSERFPR